MTPSVGSPCSTIDRPAVGVSHVPAEVCVNNDTDQVARRLEPVVEGREGEAVRRESSSRSWTSPAIHRSSAANTAAAMAWAATPARNTSSWPGRALAEALDQVGLDLAPQLGLHPPDVRLDAPRVELAGPQPGDLAHDLGIIGERVDGSQHRGRDRLPPRSHRQRPAEPVEPSLVVGEQHLVLRGEVAVEGPGGHPDVGRRCRRCSWRRTRRRRTGATPPPAGRRACVRGGSTRPLGSPPDPTGSRPGPSRVISGTGGRHRARGDSPDRPRRSGW